MDLFECIDSKEYFISQTYDDFMDFVFESFKNSDWFKQFRLDILRADVYLNDVKSDSFLKTLRYFKKKYKPWQNMARCCTQATMAIPMIHLQELYTPDIVGEIPSALEIYLYKNKIHIFKKINIYSATNVIKKVNSVSIDIDIIENETFSCVFVTDN